MEQFPGKSNSSSIADVILYVSKTNAEKVVAYPCWAEGRERILWLYRRELHIYNQSKATISQISNYSLCARMKWKTHRSLSCTEICTSLPISLRVGILSLSFFISPLLPFTLIPSLCKCKIIIGGTPQSSQTQLYVNSLKVCFQPLPDQRRCK